MCIFVAALVSNFTMIFFVTNVYVVLWLPATIFVMVSDVTVDFIIIVVTLVSRLTSVRWFPWYREAPEVFRPVGIYYFVCIYKGRPLWVEL